MNQEQFYQQLLSNEAVHVIRDELSKIHKRNVTKSEVDQVRSMLMGMYNNQAYQFYHAHRGNVRSAMTSAILAFTKPQQKPMLDGEAEYRDYQLDQAYDVKQTGSSRTRADVAKSNVVRDCGDHRASKENSIEVNKVFGFDSPFEFINGLFPSLQKQPYPPIFANSRNQNISWYNDNATSASANSHDRFNWSIMPGGAYAQGVILAQGGVLRDIVSVECGTILLPSEFVEHFNEYRKVTMLIHEFASNSMFITDKIRAHFVFNCETLPSDSGTPRIKLTNAMPDCEKYRFHKPISHMSDLTISFASPYEQISWSADRDIKPVSLTNNSGDLVVTTSYSAGHGLSNGDLVYIEGVISSMSSNDVSVINEIEDVRGHIISNVGTATFEIAGIDISTTMITNCTRIIFGSRIIDIPLQVEFLSSNKED